METLLTILAVLSIVSGFSLFFAQGKGAFFAGMICFAAGGLAFVNGSFMPILIGFACLWVLRLMGFENK